MSKENPLLLYIETATDVCSVALSEGDKIVGSRDGSDGNTHSKSLLLFMDEMMRAAGRALQEIDGVVVSIGPGSYTGLRIGVSTAKGIAYSLQCPLITVNTLESIANGCREQGVEEGAQIVPMIDARRMEVFTARYDAQMNLLAEPQALIVDEQAYAELLAEKPLYFCGNGMPKCKELLSPFANAHFVDVEISAKHMLPTAIKKWKSEEFADVAYFEPFYLKEYVAAKPNVKGLH